MTLWIVLQVEGTGHQMYQVRELAVTYLVNWWEPPVIGGDPPIFFFFFFFFFGYAIANRAATDAPGGNACAIQLVMSGGFIRTLNEV